MYSNTLIAEINELKSYKYQIKKRTWNRVQNISLTAKWKKKCEEKLEKHFNFVASLS